MNTKVCRDCGEEKPLTEFYFCAKRKQYDKYSSYCKPCHSERNRIRKKKYRKTKEGARMYKNQSLRTRYGITIDEYEKMLKEQNGVCAICGSPPYGNGLHVDHCHEEGHVRGILCTRCNVGIGQFMNNVELLQNAIKYLNT